MTARDADVIIVGSGPTGVSVAFPLVEAGLRVMMVDAGRLPSAAPPSAARYVDFRAGTNLLDAFCGADGEAFRPGRPASPKFAVPRTQFAHRGAAKANAIQSAGFVPVVSMAQGGLSVLWGAGAGVLSRQDLAGTAIPYDDLQASIRRVVARIGVAGVDGDDISECQGLGLPLQPPNPPAATARYLLDRYAARRQQAQRCGIRFGRARNAVLSRPLSGRGECRLCGLCNWGCAHRSIYNAAYELDALRAQPNFHYVRGITVDRVARNEGNWYVLGRAFEDGGERAFVAPRVILCCGALPSARLVLAALGRYGIEQPLLSSPAFAFGMLFPRLLGSAIADETFGLSQLSFAVEPPEGGDMAFGNGFSPVTLLASDLARYMPLSRPAAMAMVSALAPAMLVFNGFMSAEYGGNTLRLDRTPDGDRMVVTGLHVDRLAIRVREAVGRIARLFRPWEAVLMGAPVLTAPGEDAHYAGSLSARENPGLGETDADGAVAGLTGLYVADPSVLPVIKAKPHTVTAMANADRIGHRLAAILRDGRSPTPTGP